MDEVSPYGKEDARTTVAGPHPPTAPTRGWLPIGFVAGVRLIRGERRTVPSLSEQAELWQTDPGMLAWPLANGDDRGTRSGHHSGHRQIQHSPLGGLLFMYGA